MTAPGKQEERVYEFGPFRLEAAERFFCATVSRSSFRQRFVCSSNSERFVCARGSIPPSPNVSDSCDHCLRLSRLVEGRSTLPGEPAIELRNVTKDYLTTRALDDVCLTVNQGEIFGYVGANGAGKTTTI